MHNKLILYYKEEHFILHFSFSLVFCILYNTVKGVVDAGPISSNQLKTGSGPQINNFCLGVIFVCLVS